MEHEEYNKIKNKINDLKQQLHNLNEGNLNIDKEQMEHRTAIENHFNKLFIILQDRKQSVLESLDKECANIRNEQEKQRNTLQEKIEASCKTLECSLDMYKIQPDIAINIWREMQRISSSEVSTVSVHVVLPSIDFLTTHTRQSNQEEATTPLNTIKNEESRENEKRKHDEEINAEAKKRRTVLRQYKALSVHTFAKTQNSSANYQKYNIVVCNPIDNCIYFCDWANNAILKMNDVQTTKFVDIASPSGIVFYEKENCYFVISNYSIWRVLATGTSSIHYTVAKPKGILGGIAIDHLTGDIYVSEPSNSCIHKIDLKGISTTLKLTKSFPCGIIFHHSTNSLIVCDLFNDQLIQIQLNTDSMMSLCNIKAPSSICELANGDMLVCSETCKIYKLAASDSYKATDFAGSTEGFQDGSPQDSKFKLFEGIIFDGKTNTCFVSDNGFIRKILLSFL